MVRNFYYDHRFARNLGIWFSTEVFDLNILDT